MLLKCRDLSYGYEKALGAHIDIELNEMDTLVIEGVSGAGKTTLLRLLANMTDSDKVLWYSGDLLRYTTRFGFVFQSDQQLFPWKTALKNVMLPWYANRAALTYKAAEKKALQLLSEVGLAGQQDKYPHHLSGGMKQRVAFARALFYKPDILFLDEPFANVDEAQVFALIERLKQLQVHYGFAIVLVTHSSLYSERFECVNRLRLLRSG